MNGVIVNMNIQKSLSYANFESIRYIAKSGIAGLYGGSPFSFSRHLY